MLTSTKIKRTDVKTIFFYQIFPTGGLFKKRIFLTLKPCHKTKALTMKKPITSPQIKGIKEIPIGQEYVGFCVVRKKEKRHRTNGQPYLVLELGDRTGRLKAYLWQDIEKIESHLQPGQIVKIQAIPEIHEGQKHLKLLRIRLKRPDDDVDIDQLLPQCPKDIDLLKKKFYQHFHKVENAHLKALLEALQKDPNVLESYLKLPGGKLWHHPYLYGMLEHLVSMLEIADVLIGLFPALHADLLRTGIIVHDIGKLWDFDLKTGFVELSAQARLWGHSAAGWMLIMQKIEEIEGFPSEWKLRLGHMILSHLGEPEKGAAVPPMTLEAFALALLDALDTTLNAITRIEAKDGIPGSEWSKYIPLLQRFIYIGKQFEQSENNEKQK